MPTLLNVPDGRGDDDGGTSLAFGLARDRNPSRKAKMNARKR